MGTDGSLDLRERPGLKSVGDHYSIMSIRIGIITVSDRSSRGERLDESGPALINAVSQQGWQVVRTEILPDEIEQIEK